MLHNLLKLNDGKTEVLLIGSPHHLRNVSKTTVTVGDSKISNSSDIRNLGVIFDFSLSMDYFVSQRHQTCMLHLRCMSCIRKYLFENACNQVIHELFISVSSVTSRRD